MGLQGQVQLDAARAAVAKSMTVRQTETYVRFLLQDKPKDPNANQLNPDIKRLQEKLSDQLGAEVAIQHSAKGKGRLILKYNSLDELDGILNHIK